MKIILVFALNLLFLLCSAQNIDLTGRVSILNSGYETGTTKFVENAFVSSPYAGESSTDSEGRFQLTFASVPFGQSVSLNVKKTGLEVVNQKEIRSVILGRTPSLEIFLAPRGELALRQTEFYGVSLSAISRSHDLLLDSLGMSLEIRNRVITNLEKQLNQKISDRVEAERILSQRLDEAKAHLPSMAYNLAQINLDKASIAYRQAYEGFRSGDINAINNFLKEATLAQQAQEVITQLGDIATKEEEYRLEIEEQMARARQVIEAYSLKATAYELSFDFQNAVRVYQKGVDLLAGILEAQNLELAEAYGSLGYYNLQAGLYPAAVDNYLQNVSILELLRQDRDTSAMVVFSDLAQSYLYLNEAEAALAYLHRAEQVGQELLPRDHILMGKLWHEIAAAYLEKDQAEEAKEYLMQAGTIAKELTTSDHLLLYKFVLADMSEVATKSGRLELALQAERQILNIDQLLGAQLRPTESASTYNNLALVLGQAGQYQAALDTQLLAIQLFEEAVPDEHPTLGVMYGTLAEIYLYMSRFDEALTSQQRALAIQRGTLRDNHIDIADSYNTLSNIQLELGNLQAAYNAQVEAIRIYEEQMNVPPTKFATLNVNLARIYLYGGNVEQARRLVETNLQTLENALPWNAPSVISAYDIRAQIELGMQQYEEAVRVMQSVIERRQSSLSPNHPVMARSYVQLGQAWQGLGQAEESLTACRESARIAELNYGESNLAVPFYLAFAQACQSFEQFDTALLYQQRVFDIRKRNLPPGHVDISASYNNIALVLRDSGALTEALAYQEKSLALVLQQPDFPAAQLALVYQNLSSIQYQLEDYSAAKANMQIAIKNYEATLGRAHASTVEAYSNLASIYQKLGDLDNAIVEQRRAVNILDQNVPRDYPYRLAKLEQYNSLLTERSEQHRQNQDYFRAITDLETLVRNREEESDPTNRVILYYNIGTCYYTLKNYEQAIEAFDTGYELSPIDPAYYYYHKALCDLHLRGAGTAKDIIRRHGKTIKTENPDLLSRVNALLFLEEGKVEDAFKLLEELDGTDPSNIKWLQEETLLKSLYDNPRFQVLLDEHSGGK